MTSQQSTTIQANRPVDGERSEWSRTLLIVLLVFAVVHVVLAWLGRDPGIGWGEDDAQYLSLARDLTHFSYHERWDIAAPFHARYPPVFPLLLALVGLPTGWNVQVMLFFTAVSSAATMVIFADAIRRKFGTQIAVLVALLLTFNLTWLLDAGVLMSEVPFKFFLACALWSLSREDEGTRFAVLAGASVILASLTRTAGLAFVGALVVYWLWQRRFRWVFVFCIASALTVGAWFAWSAYAPDAQSHRLYVADIKALGDTTPSAARPSRSFAEVLVHRIATRLELFGTVMVPFVLGFRTVGGTIVDNVAWLVFFLITASIGFVVMMRRWLAGAAILASYVALLVLWTWAVERFLSPVTPLLYVAMLSGAIWLTRRYIPRRATTVFVVLAVLLTIGPVSMSLAFVKSREGCDRAHTTTSPGCFSDDDRLYLQMAAWVRDSIPPNAVLMANKDAAFYTHSGHRVINQLRALEEDSLTIIPYLRQRGVDYVVIGPVGMRILEHSQLLAKACKDLILVKEFPKASSILRVRREHEASDGGKACRALEPWTHLKRRGADE